MSRDRLNSKVLTGVRIALALNIAATILDNMPDAKLPISGRVGFLGLLPGWKFFAPNPGMENIDILCRTRHEGSEWSRWTGVPVDVPAPTWLATVWNPWNRTSKAVFDIAQQIRIYSGFRNAYGWAIQTEGYKVLVGYVAKRAQVPDGDEYQVMVVASVPGSGGDEVKPIFVSPPISRGEGARA